MRILMGNEWMKGYAVELHKLRDEDGGGYMAYIVELGHSTCSVCGNTVEEALSELEHMLDILLKVMGNQRQPIPPPQGDPAYAPRCNLISVAEQLYRLRKSKGKSRRSD
jgi:predicted RNase H-like HicB family nuclease